ncbi:uncharacterized protein [Physcomitrium patens]|uniref:uncharacterized protein isoform X2 n=1 Tax=Physcomitrium patens TaxID=3218 RepID=UPI003CCD1652
MAEEPPSQGEVKEGKSVAGVQGKGLEYCEVLSEEQLAGFYEKAAIGNAAANKFLALEVLKLPNFTYEGKTAFAQEEHFRPAQTLLVYQLAMEVLEKIKSKAFLAIAQFISKYGIRKWLENKQNKISLLIIDVRQEGASMKKIEKIFKSMIFSWSVKVKSTAHVAVLTTIELQKIVPFFMETVFQHHRLYRNLFNRESLQWRYCEEVYINTPPDDKFLKPLKQFNTIEEINLDRESKELHCKELVQGGAERQVPEAEAQSWRDKTSEPKRPPNNLDEYIDFRIRDTVEQVTLVMQEQYEARKSVLYNRIDSLRSMSK